MLEFETNEIKQGLGNEEEKGSEIQKKIISLKRQNFRVEIRRKENRNVMDQIRKKAALKFYFFQKQEEGCMSYLNLQEILTSQNWIYNEKEQKILELIATQLQNASKDDESEKETIALRILSLQGGTPQIINLISNGETNSIRRNSASFICNLLSLQVTSFADLCVQNKLIEKSFQILNSFDIEERKIAIILLFNIAVSSEQNRILLINSDVITQIERFLLNFEVNISILQNITFLIYGLLLDIQRYPIKQFHPILKILQHIWQQELKDSEMKQNLLEAVLEVVKLGDDQTEDLVENFPGMISSIISFLQNHSQNTVYENTRALNIILYCCAGYDQVSRTLIEQGLLQLLELLFNDFQDKGLKILVLNIFGNLCSTTRDVHICLIERESILNTLFQTAKREVYQMKRTASKALCLLTINVELTQIQNMIDRGIINILISVLDFQDKSLSLFALKAIFNILYLGGILQQSESLYTNPYQMMFENQGGFGKLYSLCDQETMEKDEFNRIEEILNHFDSQSEQESSEIEMVN